jgi:hypothetical protein
MSVELKAAENICTIEGILSEVNLREDTSKNTGKPYIMGEVKVKTKATILGVETELEVPVRVFANQTTNKGLPNPAYDSIKKIGEMVSLASCEGDLNKADIVRFENANIQMNEYYNRNDQLVSFPTVRGTFCRKVNKDTYNPTATFSNVIVVGGFKDEVDKNGDPTGRLIIKGILPQFGNKVQVIDYIVASEAAINHIQTYWQKGDTVRVAGIANFSYTVETEIVEMGFGDPEIKRKTRSVSELLVTKGSEGALDAELAYDPEVISAALTERQAYLTELKNNAGKRADVTAKNTTTDFGF